MQLDRNPVIRHTDGTVTWAEVGSKVQIVKKIDGIYKTIITGQGKSLMGKTYDITTQKLILKEGVEPMNGTLTKAESVSRSSYGHDTNYTVTLDDGTELSWNEGDYPIGYYFIIQTSGGRRNFRKSKTKAKRRANRRKSTRKH